MKYQKNFEFIKEHNIQVGSTIEWEDKFEIKQDVVINIHSEYGWINIGHRFVDTKHIKKVISKCSYLEKKIIK